MKLIKQNICLTAHFSFKVGLRRKDMNGDKIRLSKMNVGLWSQKFALCSLLLLFSLLPGKVDVKEVISPLGDVQNDAEAFTGRIWKDAFEQLPLTLCSLQSLCSLYQLQKVRNILQHFQQALPEKAQFVALYLFCIIKWSISKFWCLR